MLPMPNTMYESASPVYAGAKEESSAIARWKYAIDLWVSSKLRRVQKYRPRRYASYACMLGT